MLQYCINLLNFLRLRSCHHLLNELGNRKVGETVYLTQLGGCLGPYHLAASLQLLGVVHLAAPDDQLGLERPG